MTTSKKTSKSVKSVPVAVVSVTPVAVAVPSACNSPAVAAEFESRLNAEFDFLLNQMSPEIRSAVDVAEGRRMVAEDAKTISPYGLLMAEMQLKAIGLAMKNESLKAAFTSATKADVAEVEAVSHAAEAMDTLQEAKCAADAAHAVLESAGADTVQGRALRTVSTLQRRLDDAAAKVFVSLSKMKARGEEGVEYAAEQASKVLAQMDLLCRAAKQSVANTLAVVPGGNSIRHGSNFVAEQLALALDAISGYSESLLALLLQFCRRVVEVVCNTSVGRAAAIAVTGAIVLGNPVVASALGVYLGATAITGLVLASVGTIAAVASTSLNYARLPAPAPSRVLAPTPIRSNEAAVFVVA